MPTTVASGNVVEATNAPPFKLIWKVNGASPPVATAVILALSLGAATQVMSFSNVAFNTNCGAITIGPTVTSHDLASRTFMV